MGYDGICAELPSLVSSPKSASIPRSTTSARAETARVGTRRDQKPAASPHTCTHESTAHRAARRQRFAREDLVHRHPPALERVSGACHVNAPDAVHFFADGCDATFRLTRADRPSATACGRNAGAGFDVPALQPLAAIFGEHLRNVRKLATRKYVDWSMKRPMSLPTSWSSVELSVMPWFITRPPGRSSRKILAKYTARFLRPRARTCRRLRSCHKAHPRQRRDSRAAVPRTASRDRLREFA